MTTRPAILIALFASTLVLAAQPPAPAPTTVAPKPAAAAEGITIKDSQAPKPAITQSTTPGAGKGTISVDFPDADIRTILRNVADLFELNLVIPDTLQGKTTIKLRDVTWRQIFQLVLSPVGYTFVEDGNIIRVVSNESLQQEPTTTQVFILNYARAQDIMATVGSLVDPAAGGRIVVDARSNALVVTERPSRLARIKSIIDSLDKSTDQVMIESKFVEVTDSDVKNVGVNWSSLSGYKLSAAPGTNGLATYDRTQQQGLQNSGSNQSATNTSANTGQNSGSTNSSNVTSTNGALNSVSSTGSTAGTSIDNSSQTTGALNALQSIAGATSTTRALSAVFSASEFDLVLSALSTLQGTRVVSNPTIVTLNNTQAMITVGEKFPVPKYTYNQEHGTFEVSGFDWQDIGVILRVTPQVNARGFIKLRVHPEVSQQNGVTSFGGAGGANIPIIATRSADTEVSLKDGYTMGIGGLLQRNTTKTTTKVPLLGDIPLFGRLFSNKSNNVTTTNLLIFITAKIISADGASPEQVFDTNQLREMRLRRSDLPGYRDTKIDPYVPEQKAPVKPKKGFFHWTRSDDSTTGSQ